ncbi:helix-turn-helix domain-containing protein [Amycolatopsis sp. NPDC051106]|uniref:helix-turn-helix domain-containing protein n=1 Tax=unclassified Amycolatopsis TaxID=2618356 RepID=UPI0034235FE7
MVAPRAPFASNPGACRPLGWRTARGDIDAQLVSVEAYLARRRSVPEAAVLSVHGNTLRYQLDRFAGLTGADLQDTETMSEVWWALQHRKLRGARSDSV